MSSRRIPAWRVTLDGRDLTDRLAPRLLDLTLTEHRGGEADELSLRIHDHDGRQALPSRGAELTVALGWQGSALVDKGKFRVDEIEHSGAPDIISLRARSADLTAALRNRRERSWDQTTLGDILRAIAGEHSLTPRIATQLAEIAVPHLDQTESDANLLTRLGKRHDAVATIKAGRLLFFPVGQGTNAVGESLPTVTIQRRDDDRHRYHIADREAYSGVRAYWHDQDGADRKGVLAGVSGDAKRLRETFGSEQEAREAAEAEWQRIQRGLATMSYTLAQGRPDRRNRMGGRECSAPSRWEWICHITGTGNASLRGMHMPVYKTERAQVLHVDNPSSVKSAKQPRTTNMSYSVRNTAP